MSDTSVSLVDIEAWSQSPLSHDLLDELFASSQLGSHRVLCESTNHGTSSTSNGDLGVLRLGCLLGDSQKVGQLLAWLGCVASASLWIRGGDAGADVQMKPPDLAESIQVLVANSQIDFVQDVLYLTSNSDPWRQA